MVYFQNRLSNKTLAGSSSEFQQLSLGLRAGLNWYPLNNSFYLNPWIAMANNLKLGVINHLNDKKYDIQPLSPFGSLHIGYRF